MSKEANFIFFRGILETLIDAELSDSSLNMSHKMLELLRSLISKREDAVFGFILGKIMSSAGSLFIAFYKRDPTEKEMSTLADIILRRTKDIKSRINATLV